MAKSEFITLRNVRVLGMGNDKAHLAGSVNSDLAGRRLAAKFDSGMIELTGGDVASGHCPTITGIPAAEMGRILDRVTNGSRPDLVLSFVDGALTHVAVRETF